MNDFNEKGDVTLVHNKKRRQMLTIVGVGLFSFVLGKVIGPKIQLFSQDYPITKKEFKNFRVVETNKEMKLYTHGGEEILIVDKDGFK